LSRVVDAAKNVIRKLDPEEVGERGGINFLNRAGFLRERLDKMAEMSDQSFISQDESYAQTALPWLAIRKDSDHFERNDAFLDFYDYYQDLCSYLRKKKTRYLKELNDAIMKENLQRRIDDEPEVPLYTVEEIEDYVVPGTEELEELKAKLEQYLVWMSKIMLGLSFENPDDNKSIVLNKQVIMQANPQTQEIYKILRKAMGGTDFGEETYTEEKVGGSE